MRFLPIVLVAAVALAGCHDGTHLPTEQAGGIVAAEPAPVRTNTPREIVLDDSDASGSPGTTQQQESTGPGPMELLLTPSAPGQPVPWDASFRLTGMNLTSDDLRWGLDLDGDGADDATGFTLPAVVSHTYIRAASLNVTAWLNVQGHNVTAFALVAPLPYPGENFSLDGSVSGPSFDGLQIHPEANRNHTFEVPVPLQSMRLTLSWDGPPVVAADLDLFLYAPDGELVASGATLDNPEIIDAVLPADLAKQGTWTARVRLYEGAETAYTLTVTYQ